MYNTNVSAGDRQEVFTLYDIACAALVLGVLTIAGVAVGALIVFAGIVAEGGV